MKARRHGAMLVVVAVVALASAAMASAASASPVWKFNGAELSSTETAVGAAISSSLSIPGATTECEHFLYSMKISNSGGTGKGEITELPLFECKTTSGTCTVKSIQAEKLPWPVHLTTVGENDYIVVEKADVAIVYTGESCALSGKVVVSGSAGGVINNKEETAQFDKATFEATKTALKVGSSTVEWNGLFPTEPFESHREESLEG